MKRSLVVEALPLRLVEKPEMPVSSSSSSTPVGVLIVATSSAVVDSVHKGLLQLRSPAVLHASCPTELVSTLAAIFQARQPLDIVLVQAHVADMVRPQVAMLKMQTGLSAVMLSATQQLAFNMGYDFALAGPTDEKPINPEEIASVLAYHERQRQAKPVPGALKTHNGPSVPSAAAAPAFVPARTSEIEPYEPPGPAAPPSNPMPAGPTPGMSSSPAMSAAALSRQESALRLQQLEERLQRRLERSALQSPRSSVSPSGERLSSHLQGSLMEQAAERLQQLEQDAQALASSPTSPAAPAASSHGSLQPRVRKLSPLGRPLSSDFQTGTAETDFELAPSSSAPTPQIKMQVLLAQMEGLRQESHERPAIDMSVSLDDIARISSLYTLSNELGQTAPQQAASGMLPSLDAVVQGAPSLESSSCEPTNRLLKAHSFVSVVKPAEKFRPRVAIDGIGGGDDVSYPRSNKALCPADGGQDSIGVAVTVENGQDSIRVAVAAEDEPEASVEAAPRALGAHPAASSRRLIGVEADTRTTVKELEWDCTGDKKLADALRSTEERASAAAAAAATRSAAANPASVQTSVIALAAKEEASPYTVIYDIPNADQAEGREAAQPHQEAILATPDGKASEASTNGSHSVSQRISKGIPFRQMQEGSPAVSAASATTSAVEAPSDLTAYGLLVAQPASASTQLLGLGPLSHPTGHEPGWDSSGDRKHDAALRAAQKPAAHDDAASDSALLPSDDPASPQLNQPRLNHAGQDAWEAGELKTVSDCPQDSTPAEGLRGAAVEDLEAAAAFQVNAPAVAWLDAAAEAHLKSGGSGKPYFTEAAGMEQQEAAAAADVALTHTEAERPVGATASRPKSVPTGYVAAVIRDYEAHSILADVASPPSPGPPPPPPPPPLSSEPIGGTLVSPVVVPHSNGCAADAHVIKESRLQPQEASRPAVGLVEAEGGAQPNLPVAAEGANLPVPAEGAQRGVDEKAGHTPPSLTPEDPYFSSSATVDQASLAASLQALQKLLLNPNGTLAPHVFKAAMCQLEKMYQLSRVCGGAREGSGAAAATEIEESEVRGDAAPLPATWEDECSASATATESLRPPVSTSLEAGLCSNQALASRSKERVAVKRAAHKEPSFSDLPSTRKMVMLNGNSTESAVASVVEAVSDQGLRCDDANGVCIPEEETTRPCQPSSWQVADMEPALARATLVLQSAHEGLDAARLSGNIADEEVMNGENTCSSLSDDDNDGFVLDQPGYQDFLDTVGRLRAAAMAGILQEACNGSWTETEMEAREMSSPAHAQGHKEVPVASHPVKIKPSDFCQD